jgi:hypothetical protein
MHKTASAVKAYFLKQIYVPEGDYRKVCHVGKHLCGENVFQVTWSTGSSMMNMSDTLELPARNDKVFRLGEKGARVSALSTLR